MGFPGRFKRPRGVFFGWRIVAIGAALNALFEGFYFSGSTVFFLPISRDLQLSRAATSLVFGLSRAQLGILSPIVGILIDRVGPRRMLITGALLSGVGYLLVSQVDSLLFFLLFYTLIASTGFWVGFTNPAIAVANQWFIRRRGLAIAIVYVGMAGGGALLIPLLGLGLPHLGWRTTILLCGIAILVVGVPLSLLVRNTPEEMGLLPDGDQVRPRETSTTTAERPDTTGEDFEVKEALKTRSFWLLVLANGVRAMVEMGIWVQIVPILVWKGLSEPAAASMVGLILLLWVPTSLGAGSLGDRWPKQRSIAVLVIIGTLGLGSLLLPGSRWYAFLFIGLFAVSLGALPLIPALTGDFFGRRRFATLRGLLISVQSLTSVGTSIYVGWIFDRTGSYQWSLIPLVALFLLAAVLFWFLPRPRRVLVPAEAN